MKIGLLGGSFNPIHFGHLILAEEARRQLSLGKVLFIPSNLSPMKNDRPAPAVERYEMVKRAIRGHPAFSVSDLEIRRGGRSYTIDTVRALKKKNPKAKFVFLIGSDCLKGLPRWREAQSLFRLCRFAVTKRPSFPFEAIPDGMEVVRMPEVGISSQDLRRRVSQGESIAYQVPKAVETYIRKHKLYR